jgi:hypothetical protein
VNYEILFEQHKYGFGFDVTSVYADRFNKWMLKNGFARWMFIFSKEFVNMKWIVGVKFAREDDAIMFKLKFNHSQL